MASTAAQSGPVAIATVDAAGTLGRSSAILDNLTALNNGATAQAARLDALSANLESLAGGVAQLRRDTFDLAKIDRRNARQGIASALAIGSAPMPSAPGRTSYVFNLSTFRGQQALGLSAMHRLSTQDPFAISAGFAYAGNHNNGGKLGVAGEF